MWSLAKEYMERRNMCEVGYINALKIPEIHLDSHFIVSE